MSYLAIGAGVFFAGVATGALIYQAAVRYGARVVWKATGHFGRFDDEAGAIDQEKME